ncbi:transglycosylase domain-containing protein [Yoonia sp. R2331]|uniref:transglycosylase domain-containing protein n=1 Tax=Yoonia sp. R2331 TaxID=3237238 RepID=UPI0034E46020
MRRLLRFFTLLVLVALLGCGIYGWIGYRDGLRASVELAPQADALIAAGQGGGALGPGRQAMLLAVEDPAFFTHVGFDLTTPGGGITTITQSLAKRQGFDEFIPGYRKLRQTTYAIGLERGLTKPQILALFLDSVSMGRGPDGDWITGLFPASLAHFDATPDAIPEDDFIALVAVMIAPRDLALGEADAVLQTRIARIKRLLEGACEPLGNSDVWLEGCAGAES